MVAHSLAKVATLWPSPRVFDYLSSCISSSNAMIWVYFLQQKNKVKYVFNPVNM